MLNKNILTIIITYNPEVEFLKKNLEKFNQSDVLIVDNHSNNIEEITLLNNNNNVIVKQNNINLGIAEALNQGLKYATDNNYQYILTMDQDSTFKNDYTQLIDGFNYTNNVAIVCPSIVDVNSNNQEIAQNKYEELFIAITSGCLCNVKILNSIGGFDSKLFIDYVDYDICLKLQEQNYKIVRARDVILNHSLGESKIYNCLGIKFISTNHSALRRYYNARNRVYLALKYKSIFPKFVVHNQLSFYKTILIILLFEEDKFQKMKSIYKGIVDAFKM